MKWFLVFLLLSASAAHAQNCAPRFNVISQLADKYGESRQAIGLGSNNLVIEVYANEETGTWTITATNVRSLMCVLAAGQAYEKISETLAPQGEKG